MPITQQKRNDNQHKRTGINEWKSGFGRWDCHDARIIGNSGPSIVQKGPLNFQPEGGSGQLNVSNREG